MKRAWLANYLFQERVDHSSSLMIPCRSVQPKRAFLGLLLGRTVAYLQKGCPAPLGGEEGLFGCSEVCCWVLSFCLLTFPSKSVSYRSPGDELQWVTKSSLPWDKFWVCECIMVRSSLHQCFSLYLLQISLWSRNQRCVPRAYPYFKSCLLCENKRTMFFRPRTWRQILDHFVWDKMSLLFQVANLKVMPNNMALVGVSLSIKHTFSVS